ncbi:MAG: hypothetical protein Q9219_006111 [cf. Caloplaca sp. 3 TL-2023]
MSIHECGEEDEDYEELQDEIHEPIMSERQRVTSLNSVSLESMVQQSNLIPTELKAGMVASILNPSNEDAALCMLLTLLPNLKSLEIDDLLADRRLLSIVHKVALATQNHQVNQSYSGTALSHLREIYLLRDCNPYGEEIAHFGVFAMLPSMRLLRGFNIYGDTFEWPDKFVAQSSTVTKINMAYSAVSANAFDGLLKGIAALKIFVYEYACPGELGALYEPVGIIHALRSHAAHSLEVLDVKGQLDSPEDWEGKILGSLQGFARLRSISLEDTIFQTHRVSPDEPTISSTRLEVGELCAMEPLINVLPASVTDFTLLQDMNEPRIDELFEDFAGLKAEKLSKLNRLTFHCINPLEDDTKDALKAAGIQLYSWKTPI